MKDKNEIMFNHIKSLFPDYNIKISKSYFREGDLACAWLEKNDYRKYVYYNYELEKVVSNPIEGSFFIRLPYGNAYTLHSYLVEGGVRAFIGITNIDNGVILPVGFDINNKNYIVFPKDNNGLIDDEEMVRIIKNENPLIRYRKDFYQEATHICQIHIILRNLIGHDDIFDKLDDYNGEEISELEKKTKERLNIKFKNRR